MKTSTAVSMSVGKNVVIGDFLCTRCYALPLDDADSFYDYMSEEHRLAQIDEEGEQELGDDSYMDTDGGLAAAKPAVDYMEESDEEMQPVMGELEKDDDAVGSMESLHAPFDPRSQRQHPNAVGSLDSDTILKLAGGATL